MIQLNEEQGKTRLYRIETLPKIEGFTDELARQVISKKTIKSMIHLIITVKELNGTVLTSTEQFENNKTGKAECLKLLKSLAKQHLAKEAGRRLKIQINHF